MEFFEGLVLVSQEDLFDSLVIVYNLQVQFDWEVCRKVEGKPPPQKMISQQVVQSYDLCKQTCNVVKLKILDIGRNVKISKNSNKLSESK